MIIFGKKISGKIVLQIFFEKWFPWGPKKNVVLSIR